MRAYSNTVNIIVEVMPSYSSFAFSANETHVLLQLPILSRLSTQLDFPSFVKYQSSQHPPLQVLS